MLNSPEPTEVTSGFRYQGNVLLTSLTEIRLGFRVHGVYQWEKTRGKREKSVKVTSQLDYRRKLRVYIKRDKKMTEADTDI